MKIRQNNFIKRRTPADDSILKMLCPSVLGMIVCVICLAGMSWAWFTEGVQSQSTIKAASYTLGETVSVKADGSSESTSEDVLEKSADGTYELSADKKYVVSLAPEAAPRNGGYCIVKIKYKDNGSEKTVKYSTAALKSNQQFSFTISNGDKAASCQLIAAWGTSEDPGTSDSIYVKGGVIIKINGGAPETSDKTSDDKGTAAQSSSKSACKSSSGKKVQSSTDSQKTKDSSTDSKTPADSDSSTDKDTSSDSTGTAEPDQTDKE